MAGRAARGVGRRGHLRGTVGQSDESRSGHGLPGRTRSAGVRRHVPEDPPSRRGHRVPAPRPAGVARDVRPGDGARPHGLHGGRGAGRAGEHAVGERGAGRGVDRARGLPAVAGRLPGEGGRPAGTPAPGLRDRRVGTRGVRRPRGARLGGHRALPSPVGRRGRAGGESAGRPRLARGTLLRPAPVRCAAYDDLAVGSAAPALAFVRRAGRALVRGAGRQTGGRGPGVPSQRPVGHAPRTAHLPSGGRAGERAHGVRQAEQRPLRDCRPADRRQVGAPLRGTRDVRRRGRPDPRHLESAAPGLGGAGHDRLGPHRAALIRLDRPHIRDHIRSSGEENMSTLQENKAVLERYYEECLNKGNLDVIYEGAGDDHISHGTAPNGKEGVEHLKEWVRLQRASFPDLHVTVDDWILEGDKVVSRFTARGTHTGEPYEGVPAQGRAFAVSGIVIDEFKDGLIVESWFSLDGLDLAKQLGALG
ncbi:hypothetical protein DEJ48_36390 [Streptomyces venezuelae]|uniref:Ester cyclase n=2 Tax=Streptomyces venezuelae TaxID=54571 RepID=A0A5P2CFC1_STRVZ|nr:hypothetical protein DEJ48_36390 [Streptomyces venezuelae]